jgi:hypothetical protein
MFTALITILSEAGSATAVGASFGMITIQAMLTTSHLIMTEMSFPRQELVFNDLNSSESHWRPG